GNNWLGDSLQGRSGEEGYSPEDQYQQRKAQMRAAIVERENTTFVMDDEYRSMRPVHDQPPLRLQLLEAARRARNPSSVCPSAIPSGTRTRPDALISNLLHRRAFQLPIKLRES